MAGQPFDRLLFGDRPLLREVETVVVDAHRRWYTSRGGTDWSEPKAYHWLHYEDPDPVARLADGVRRLPAGYGEAAVVELEKLAAGLGRRRVKDA
jgi:hypothetical protein